MQLGTGALERQYILWLFNLVLLAQRKPSGNLHFMPFPGVQVYVVQVIQSVVLRRKKSQLKQDRESRTNTQLMYLYSLTYFVSSAKHVSPVPNCGTGMSRSG